MTTRLKLTAGAARPAMETAPAVIDMTPTWGAIMPALVAALQDGTAQGRDIARQELTRLAAAVDSANAAAKAELDDARASYTARGDSLHTARGERDDARAVLATVRENMAEARTTARHAEARATAEAERADKAEAELAAIRAGLDTMTAGQVRLAPEEGDYSETWAECCGRLNSEVIATAARADKAEAELAAIRDDLDEWESPAALAFATTDSYRRGMAERVATWGRQNDNPGGGDAFRAFSLGRASAFYHVAAELAPLGTDKADAFRAASQKAYNAGVAAHMAPRLKAFFSDPDHVPGGHWVSGAPLGDSDTARDHAADAAEALERFTTD